MSEHRVKVDDGKYEFIARRGFVVDVERYGESWVQYIDAGKAVQSMMYELDAARVVLEAARTFVTIETLNGRGDDCKSLRRALDTHDACVGHQPAPTQWARSYCLCAGGDAGGHEPDCDRHMVSAP